MSWWTVGWAVWLAAFAALEGAALARRAPGATFSEHVWSWFRVRDSRPTRLVVATRAILVVFLAWLAGHLAFGWFTPSDPWPWGATGV